MKGLNKHEVRYLIAEISRRAAEARLKATREDGCREYQDGVARGLEVAAHVLAQESEDEG